jgi:hypothetical protein
MIAIGTSNILGSFASSYPITGSFSRTAVNAASGVRTPFNGIYTGKFKFCPYSTIVDLNCQNLMFFTYSRFGAFGHFGLDAVLLLHSEKLLGGCHHLRRDFHGGNQLNENGLEVKEYEHIILNSVLG